VRQAITVAELCDLYLKDAKGRVKASTLAMDKSRIETHADDRPAFRPQSHGKRCRAHEGRHPCSQDSQTEEEGSRRNCHWWAGRDVAHRRVVLVKEVQRSFPENCRRPYNSDIALAEAITVARRKRGWKLKSERKAV